MRLSIPSLLVLLPILACKGESSDPPLTGQASSTIRCSPDPARIAAAPSCVDSEQCPCGSSCVLGACVVPECATADECSDGETCDSFGQCRGAEDTALVPAAVPEDRTLPERPPPGAAFGAGRPGQIRVNPEIIQIEVAEAESDPDLARPIDVFAFAGDLDPLRVAVPAPLEVACGTPSSFGPECQLSIPAGTSARAWVRPRADAPPFPRQEVRFYHEDAVVLIGYFVDPEPPPTVLPRDGVYEGFAQLDSLGIGSDREASSSTLRLPIRVELRDEGAHVAIVDALGMLLPAGPWVGSATWGPGPSGRITLPRAPWLAGAGADYSVRLAPQQVAVRQDLGADLDLSFELAFEGLVHQGTSPSARWHLRADRVRDLPSGRRPSATPASGIDTSPAFLKSAAEREVDALIDALFAMPMPPPVPRPEVERRIVELILCRDDDAPPQIQLEIFDRSFGHFSGDVRCANGRRGVAIASANAADDGRGATAAALLASCIADATGLTWSTDRVARFGSAGCLDAERIWAALGWVGRRAATGEASEAEYALFHRLLQQWIGVHSFIAREVEQRARIEDVVGRDLGSLASPRPEWALETVLKSWDLLLYPRMATGIAHMPAALLSAPDYRTRLFTPTPEERVAMDATPEASVGLAVAIADGLAAQASLAHTILERGWREGRLEGLEATRAFMHRAIVVRAIAAAMASRAAPDATWKSRYQASVLSLDLALARLAQRAEDVTRGVNPLGIEDSDLPLYFPSDLEGADRRFSAISDYLVSVTGAWVPRAIAQAEDDLEGARSAYLRQQERDLQVTLSRGQIETDTLDVKRAFGKEIAEICGLRPGMRWEDVLDDWTDFNGATCHLREKTGDENKDCKILNSRPLPDEEGAPVEEPFAWQSTLSLRDLRVLLCAYSYRVDDAQTAGQHWRDIKGAPFACEINGYGDNVDLSVVSGASALPLCAWREGALQYPVACNYVDAYGEQHESKYCATCSYRVQEADLGGTVVHYVSSMDAPGVPGAQTVTVPIDERLLALRDGDKKGCERHFRNSSAFLAKCALQVDGELVTDNGLPSGRLTKATPTVPPPSVAKIRSGALQGFLNEIGSTEDPAILDADLSKCVRGAQGGLAIDIESMELQVQKAYTALSEHRERYEKEIGRCVQIASAAGAINGAFDSLNATMSALSVVKAGALVAANTAAGVKDCVSGIQAASGPQGAFNGWTAGGICVAAGVEAVALSIADGIDARMGEVERAHARLVARIEGAKEVRTCYIGAEKELIGTRSLILDINAALLSLSSAAAAFDRSAFAAQQLYHEGQAAVTALRDKRSAVLAFSFWLDERVESFDASMRRARRATYLAVRALEYERQISSVLRQDVLSASAPADLRRVLERLESVQLTRGIDGRRPSQHSLVLSLREQLLQLDDRSDVPEATARSPTSSGSGCSSRTRSTPSTTPTGATSASGSPSRSPRSPRSISAT